MDTILIIMLVVWVCSLMTVTLIAANLLDKEKIDEEDEIFYTICDIAFVILCISSLFFLIYALVSLVIY